MLRWLKKIYRLYIEGAEDNNYPIREHGLLGGKETKPCNLDGCVVALNHVLVYREEMKEWSEDKFTASLHHNIGRWLRNNWGLWDENSKLHKWFKARGIWHADDMSGIILTTYYRSKHNLPIQLNEQIETYKKYWEK